MAGCWKIWIAMKCAKWFGNSKFELLVTMYWELIKIAARMKGSHWPIVTCNQGQLTTCGHTYPLYRDMIKASWYFNWSSRALDQAMANHILGRHWQNIPRHTCVTRHKFGISWIGCLSIMILFFQHFVRCGYLNTGFSQKVSLCRFSRPNSTLVVFLEKSHNLHTGK